MFAIWILDFLRLFVYLFIKFPCALRPPRLCGLAFVPRLCASRDPSSFYIKSAEIRRDASLSAPSCTPITMLRVAPLLILLTGAPEATAKEPRRNPLGVRDSRRQLSTASDKLVVDADGLVDRVKRQP